jgi:hypothetical protein
MERNEERKKEMVSGRKGNGKEERQKETKKASVFAK